MKSQVKIKHCALEYLNYWISFDRKIWCALNSPQKTEECKKYKAKQLQRAAKEYSVARTVRKIDEEERFSEVLDIIERYSNDINKDNRAEQIVTIENKIFKKYNKNKNGNRVLSFTTKILWMKHRDPIIIYDRNAREALDFHQDHKNTLEDYLKSYFNKWECEYKKKESEIKETCKSLKDIKAWTEGAHSLSDEKIDNIVNKPWFWHRVFDFYLWKKD